MNYHIMIPDKFIDSYIEDIYAVGEEKNNVFWIRGEQGSNLNVSSNRKVEWIGWDVSLTRKKLLSVLKQGDNVFIHWYNLDIGRVVVDLPLQNKLFVYQWGGDFFDEPLMHHASWLFDEKTLKIVTDRYTPVVTARRNPYHILLQWRKKVGFKEKIESEFEEKLKQVGRIDYLIMSEFNLADFSKTRTLYPSLRAKHLPGFYDVNFDLAVNPSRSLGADKGKCLNILVGNSSTFANNHLEAFDKINLLKNIEVYCPLSYGDSTYREIVIKKGRKMFGDKFHALTDFMSRTDYVDFLNKMDIVFMYHNRSQAWGNVATALTLGKPVFLKRKNSLKEFIDDIEIETYDAEKIEDYSLYDLIRNSIDSAETNLVKLDATISREKRLFDLKKVMTEYAR